MSRGRYGSPNPPKRPLWAVRIVALPMSPLESMRWLREGLGDDVLVVQAQNESAAVEIAARVAAKRARVA